MDSYYLREISATLTNIYNLLLDTVGDIERNTFNILLSVCFFGLITVALRFFHVKRNDL